jgi:sugar/nucleoside kinase (ribokinase family)
MYYNEGVYVMAKILISGLVNMETTLKVRRFPIEYYPFFGVNTVGAGDALFSAFLHYHCKGFSSLEALKRAQIFASAKITANGGGLGFAEESKIDEYYCRFAAEMKPF